MMSSPTLNPVPNPNPNPNPNQADELFALLRARLERHLKEVMENVAVEAATAALGRIEPRRARLRRVSEREDGGEEETSSHTV